jgi:hypothetical protein
MILISKRYLNMESQISLYISASAVVVSFISFLLSFRLNKKLYKENKRYKEAIFHMERNTQFEGKLAEWYGAFKFYGIDIEAATNEGISKEQITYLILSLNAQSSICQMKGISVYDHIKSTN